MVDSVPTSLFHPVVARWFETSFDQPTPVQTQAWEQISQKQNTLVAAPTGSGKTLAAFLNAISDLVTLSRKQILKEQVYVLYVSPLKALSNDIERNLQIPLEAIEQALADAAEPATGIRAMVRTGDTPPGDREKMRRHPPQILVTTPESLYLLLTSASGRAMLAHTQSVIVDEIHAIAGNKRGSHLALSLARLDALCGAPPVRIGLSATQKPLSRIADFLCGGRACAIVDTGHQRQWDLQLELPDSPLTAVMANECWTEIYDRLAQLIEKHETTLIFVNTRRLAERLSRHLAERIGDSVITAHHGSLSRKHRLEAEQALKGGQLKALVATASLELGIDIGHVDLVCQLSSPGSIAGLLQRVGRSGHTVGEIPKGRLFPLSRDDLVECVALLEAVNLGELDAIEIPDAPLDVLAQHLVAECSAVEWNVNELHTMVCSAWPYRSLSEAAYEEVVNMLASGYATRRGRRAAWLFYDAVNGRLKGRPAARLTALQNGGAIPDHFDYEVLMLPQGHRVGTLNEDFAFESMPGDIFQLGNTSYRILKVEQGRVLVEDAKGQPPTIPFWVGDAPGRSDELSSAVSRFREHLDAELQVSSAQTVVANLVAQGCVPAAAGQVVEYLDAARQALGCLPGNRKIVLERFFDDSGDMHLVIHATLGSRIMRAWGLALRKRFCRTFNFELQASALEDSLILSLGETHSFDLEGVTGYLKAETVRDVLIQALLDVPMFEVRWRWTATIALAVQRMRNGQKLPPQWQRNQAEDLVAVVFPDQLACLENIAGAREVPDHPLVRQTINDCLHDNMDIVGLENLLQSIANDEIEILCTDLTGPSPLSREIINARPYAFLDDGEAENRRTRAISGEPDDLANAANLRIISTAAIDQVRNEAWIAPRNPDELHDGLLQTGFLVRSEFESGVACTGASADAGLWPVWFTHLTEQLRAHKVETAEGLAAWVATERLNEWLAIHPDSTVSPAPGNYNFRQAELEKEPSMVALLTDRMNALGPISAELLAGTMGLNVLDIQQALLGMQGQGTIIAMPDSNGKTRWCERRLLARIHRYSRERRRRAVKPVSPASYARFLMRWHALDEPATEVDQALGQLEGWALPVPLWERAVLGIRCKDFNAADLDLRFLSGEMAWFRPRQGAPSGRQVVAATPVAIVPRDNLHVWLSTGATGLAEAPSDRNAYADKVAGLLNRKGAMFTRDIEQESGLLRPHLEEALKQLVYEGAVTADAFSPLRWLLRPGKQKSRLEKRGRPMSSLPVGRWSLVETDRVLESESRPAEYRQQQLDMIARALLRRYGVVFRAVLAKENQLPPWRELLRYFRRLEDRGEVLGGRFVDGFSGEQFALPEAVGLLRQARNADAHPTLVAVSSYDPLNLGGWILSGPKTPASLQNRILLEDGLPVARLLGDNFEELPGISKYAKLHAREKLTVLHSWRKRQH